MKTIERPQTDMATVSWIIQNFLAGISSKKPTQSKKGNKKNIVGETLIIKTIRTTKKRYINLSGMKFTT